MLRGLAFISALALLAATSPASAADTGQAFDQITKFVQSGDVATLEPGDFQADWQVAAAPAPEHKAPGGMFAKLRSAIDQAGAMGSMMRNGLAEQHYVAGAKERIDTPATQKATITDCTARTVTYLDLKAKTYRVVSMDQPVTPSSASGGRSEPGPRPTDDGTRTSITAVNRALGAKQVFGNNANGYTSEVTIVTTRGDGSKSTAKSNVKEYVSGASRLWLNCSERRTESQEGMAASMSRFNEMMRSLGGGKDPRITVSSSGPALPGTLAYYEAMAFSGEQTGARSGGTFVMQVERDHVRTISSNDSVFSVPADFTKTDDQS